MAISNREYYRNRMDEENRRASAEGNTSVRHIHVTMANLYRIRLNSEERSAEKEPTGLDRPPAVKDIVSQRDLNDRPHASK